MVYSPKQEESQRSVGTGASLQGGRRAPAEGPADGLGFLVKWEVRLPASGGAEGGSPGGLRKGEGLKLQLGRAED